MQSWQRLTAGALLSAAALAPAWAQTEAIKLVVGAPPGGTTDTVARSIAQTMAKDLQRTVLVENRPGAGGNIAADYVAKSRADGTTLLVTFTGFSINASLYRKLPFDPVKDFTPISMLAQVPSVLVARKDFPANDIPELLKQVKADPGKYTMALGAVGSSLHLAGERMKMLADLDILNVPYKGTSPALADLLGGQVDMMFASSLSAQPHIKSGSLKALGVTSPQQLPQYPGVKPIGDTVKGFESNAWFALLGPADLPPQTLQSVNAAASKAVAAPEFRKLLENESATAVSSSPEELGAFVRQDIDRYAEIVKFTGATVD
ncbi:tripartite tricarboxylate transporter substrate binding protein [Bordetella holmesii]|uniref:Tripartite tricarboxylate transporter family receptor n=2 Tax=Bordetella holmesii TaxID=35814 RepID=A0A158M4W0_9BORD|nr:tripartite tricarboxylate transporter substrate binding protein [Bordetella holmesii]AMD44832.1 MFS transporter [Bordetella holmesii H558]AMD49702.1 MFS transporter [Bordetella holmesii F627]AOB36928.1 MFS transporter [Bordetella holmesii]AUL20881.1 MFS transporter [Bordetella holmesii]AUL24216.1 MFS transporter [Bordetella holmesii]